MVLTDELKNKIRDYFDESNLNRQKELLIPSEDMDEALQYMRLVRYSMNVLH